MIDRLVSRIAAVSQAERGIPRRLRFRLPDSPAALSATAEVIGNREGSGDRRRGVALRFLGVDRTSADLIEQHVHERSATQDSVQIPVR